MASLWLLPSLGNGMLWQDEAQTALLARTTLRHGAPIAFDGPNSISQERGDDYGSHGLWKWHMWLPFYVLAGFFRVLGESTAIARLPFALFGVATVWLSYFTAMRLWRDTKTAVLTALLILACVPFALLARQCRYYNPAMFFSLLMLHAYLRICGGARRGWILLVVAATLLFNSHFIYCATGFAAIALHAAVWHRDRWKPLMFAGFATGVLCAAPALWLASLNYRNYSGSVMHWSAVRFQFQTYAGALFRQILPYPMLAIPLFLALKAATKKPKTSPALTALEPWALPLFFAGITLIVIIPFTPYPFFRYLGPLIAPLQIVIARWVIAAFRINIVLGIGALILLGTWWPMQSYVYELQHPFVGPLEGIVPLLLSKGKIGDVVVISYDDLPLKFYTRFRIVGGLTGEDFSTGRGARWLILRATAVSADEIPVRAFIAGQLRENPSYQPIVLHGFPDTRFENREDPEEHQYKTWTRSPPVVVYELRP